MKASVTWLGHSSASVAFGDEKVLIDPFGRRRMARAQGYSAILITHSHIDHLNRWTLGRLDKTARLIVPFGARSLVADLGFREVLEVRVGDSILCGEINVTAVATKHDNGRWGKGDHPICVGYILQKKGIIVHHAGDVDMSTFEVFDEIGKSFAIDATMMPISGMLPPWYYHRRRGALDAGIHIESTMALDVARRLGAKSMIPIHWGTVSLRLFHSVTAPRTRLLRHAQAQGVGDLIKVLQHGQTLELSDLDA